MEPATTIRLHSGAAMPILGLGTWELTGDPAGTVGEAVARGYRMIDTAADYGSQPGIGEAVTDRSVGGVSTLSPRWRKRTSPTRPRGGISASFKRTMPI